MLLKKIKMFFQLILHKADLLGCVCQRSHHVARYTLETRLAVVEVEENKCL